MSISSVLEGEIEAVGGARALGRAAVISPGIEREIRALEGPVEASDTDFAAAAEEEERACGEARALGDTVGATDTDPSRRLRFSHH